MHTRLDDSTDHLALTVELKTTLAGHSVLSRHPEVWESLVSIVRGDLTRALRDAQHKVNYYKALDDTTRG